jgi:3-oxoacyl-[acyl-carrier protein] reductase
MLQVSGAVAVITGGSGGIGESVARCWVKNGGKVVLAARNLEKLRRVEKEIAEMGGEVAVIACDVTREGDNHALACFAVEKFGAINLVLPAAGIIKDGFMVSIDRDTGKVTGKMSLERFQSVIDVNLTGVFLTVRECAEQMINLGCKGLICLISSTGSLGTAGQINYSSTKAAMSVIPSVITAEFFRRNVADRIRCVAVAPGYVATPLVKAVVQKVLDRILEQVPIKRLVEPDEVASLIIELYRNEACASEVFYIHGGLRLGSIG